MAESRRFKPHYNNALGKYYHTSRDYVSDMKKQGMEPYNPNNVRREERKGYTPSKEAREVAKAGAEQMKRDGKVSGAVMDWIVKNGNAKAAPDAIRNKLKGGMYQD